MEKLKIYDWPGNIRELENTIERANIIAPDAIKPEHILLPESHLRWESPAGFDKDLKTAGAYGREYAEARLIKRILGEVGGNKSEAARKLKVSYKTFLTRITKYTKKGLL